MMMQNYWHKYESEGFYHIYNRAPDSRNIFDESEDYEFFLSRYLKYFSLYFQTYAYCLMPNHYHFLVQVQNELIIKKNIISSDRTNAITSFLNEECTINELIEDQFRRFHSSYAITFNNKNHSRGQVFMNRHKRIIETEDSKIEFLICYIHHNPVHHGFCSDFIDWNHSSYREYIKRQGTIINVEAGLGFMGGIDNFIKIHDQFKLESMLDMEIQG